MKKTAVLLIFCLWQVSMALQAPYLFAADSVADTAIQLTWRNNSTAYLGIIVLRKTAGAGQYSAIDTSPGGATSFTDVVRPSAQTTYYYALTAYSQTEHADTSNSDSVMITPAPGIVFLFAPLRLDAEWNAVSHIMTISFFDSSNVEAGYRILRSANFGTPQLIRDIPSVIPASTGTISFNDSSPVLPNTWYRYYGTVYRAADSSRTSQSNPVYAFDRNIMTNELIAAAPRKCVLSNKIGSFPIKYRSWSLKAGDTIVLNEKGMPADSMFSIINVSNPAVPKYAGTGASIAARFDTASMAGAFAVTRGRTIFGCFAYQLYMLEYHNGTIQVVKSLQGPGYFLCLNPSFLSDTTFVIAGSYSEMAGIAGASTEYSLARYAFGSTTI
ncbi:MAG TPA: hypothetical protein VKF42_01880, partial [Chitinivibrionales bacterium]|nr:hypothetical protein [Chitinivibrionales bacterium]